MPDRREDTSPVVRLGASACPNDFLTGSCGPCVEWVQVCLEVEWSLMVSSTSTVFVLNSGPYAETGLGERLAPFSGA
jgi:hypothetical protein